MENEMLNGTAMELLQVCAEAVAESGDAELPVFVEDEEGQIEPICNAWYDPTRKMLRLSLRSIRFKDYEE